MDDDEDVLGANPGSLSEEVDEELVEPPLGGLAAIDAIGDGEHDEVVASWRTDAEGAVKRQFVGFVLVDDPEVVIGRHSECLDERVVSGSLQAGEVLGRLAAQQRNSDEWHEMSSRPTPGWASGCSVMGSAVEPVSIRCANAVSTRGTHCQRRSVGSKRRGRVQPARPLVIYMPYDI